MKNFRFWHMMALFALLLAPASFSRAHNVFEEKGDAASEDSLKDDDMPEEDNADEKDDAMKDDDAMEDDDADDENDGKEWDEENTEEKIVDFLEHVGEFRARASNIQKSKYATEVAEILNDIEAKLLYLKQVVATGEYSGVDDKIEAIKRYFKEVEAVVEKQSDEKSVTPETFKGVLAKIQSKLNDLADRLGEAQDKINEKYAEGRDVTEVQALLEEVKMAFGEANDLLAEAVAAQVEGNMKAAGYKAYSAFSSAKVAWSLYEKMNFQSLKSKEKTDLSLYNELLWKVKNMVDIIGEYRSDALGRSNESNILDYLDKVESRINDAYELLLQTESDVPESDLENIDDELEGAKRWVKKAKNLFEKGEVSNEEALDGEEAQQAASELLERVTKRYNTFSSRYDDVGDELSSDEQTVLSDLLDKVQANLATAQTYYDREDYVNAQRYGYAALVASKTGKKLVKNF